MKKSGSKVLIFLLALLLVIPVTSCSNKSPNESSGGTEGNTTEGGGTEDTTPPHATYGGQPVHIYAWEPFTTEYVVSEEYADVDDVSRALYARDLYVEEELDVDISYYVFPGQEESKSEQFIIDLEKSVMVGDGAYDFVIQYNNNAGNATIRGLYLNLTENNELNLYEDYWTPRLTEAVALGDKVYFATGDIVTTITKNVYCMHYNKNLIAARGLENPYDLVQNNEWTWDKVFEMAKNCYVDSGTAEDGWDDSYGLVLVGQGVLDSMYFSAGLTLIEKDEDGFFSVSSDYCGDTATSFMSMIRDFTKTEDCLYAHTGEWVNYPDGKSLFSIGVADYVGSIIESEANFKPGVAPLPKYNADQDGYYANHANNYSFVSIPFDCYNKEISGAVMEYMAKDGNSRVTPALFEDTFKLQYSESPEDAYMFDVVRASATFEPGLVYIGTFQFAFAKCIIGTQEWGSTSTTVANNAENELIPILEGLAGLKR